MVELMFGLITRLECYHINLAESLVLALEKHNILRSNDEQVVGIITVTDLKHHFYDMLINEL